MTVFRKLSRACAAVAVAGALSMLPAVSSLAAVSPAGAIATGVDVSKHNGAVNWQAAAGAGVQFAFIKVGSTNSGVDPYFTANITNANNAGIRTGVYIYSYATNVEQAVNEANLVLSWINDYPVNYPVVYDVEDSIHKGNSKEELAAMANAFCAVIEAAGYYPMVYASKNWFEGKIGNVGYDKWVAQYNDSCQYGGNISFWQSTSHAYINGFNGRVDFNYQYKDYSSLIIPEGFLNKNGITRFYRNWRMQRGWVDYAGTRFYLDGGGTLQKGIWYGDQTGTYFLTPEDGRIATGQYKVGGNDYYFSATGAKTVGWVKLEDRTLFYDPLADGIMKREWYSDEAGRFYYFDKTDGRMMTGPVTIQKKNYYFGADGVRHSGLFASPEGAWYYDPATGEMLFGWINTEDKTYYADAAGRIVVGLIPIDKKNYYFDASGVLQRNQEIVLEGVTYVLDEQGAATVKPAPEPAAPEAVPPVQ